ncbi:MAG: hypothetical protein WDA03_08430 [Trueperaceae bacterium]
MTTQELAEILAEEMSKRDWNVSRLAKEARLPFETTRRAVRAMGNLTLETTTKLLVAVDRELTTVEVQA